jgi:hypothetical protein
MNTSSRLLKALAVVAVVFGIATVLSGGRALFGGPEARAAVGNAVPFVLWFNTLAGFVYIAAGIGLWRARPWAPRLAWLIAIATLFVFVAFAVHVATGGAFEMRTVGAMTLRSLVWLAIAWLGWSRLAAESRSA